MSYNENRYNLWQPFFKMAASKMSTVSNQVPIGPTCRPIIILISENLIYRFYAHLVTCLIAF